jgi:hypothetical protein
VRSREGMEERAAYSYLRSPSPPRQAFQGGPRPLRQIPPPAGAGADRRGRSPVLRRPGKSGAGTPLPLAGAGAPRIRGRRSEFRSRTSSSRTRLPFDLCPLESSFFNLELRRGRAARLACSF